MQRQSTNLSEVNQKKYICPNDHMLCSSGIYFKENGGS